MRMVADAVVSNPFYYSANREKNREFRKIRPLCNLESLHASNIKGFQRIPYATEQGNFLKEQGICTREQRI